MLGSLILSAALLSQCGQCQAGYAPQYSLVAYQHNFRNQVICVQQGTRVAYGYVPAWSLMYPSQWDYEVTEGVPLLAWPQQPLARPTVCVGHRTWTYDFSACNVRAYRFGPRRVFRRLFGACP